MRSVERGICPIATSWWTNCSNNYGRMHWACPKPPYFHFRSEIWRHHRVPRPRFPLCRENFCVSHTFRADIGLLNICMVFKTFRPKMGFLWCKIGEGVVRYWPITNSFFLMGFLTSVPILVKIDQEMRPWITIMKNYWPPRHIARDVG